MTAFELLELMLWGTAGVLAMATLWTLARVRRLRRVVGPVRSSERRGRWLRNGEIVLAVLTLIVLSRVALPLSAAPAMAVLIPALWIFALHPGEEDSVWGEEGVQRGWHARRYAELEEWRLTGDHLRWKLEGLWVACRVPTSEQPQLRAKLTATCPERESRFKH